MPMRMPGRARTCIHWCGWKILTPERGELQALPSILLLRRLLLFAFLGRRLLRLGRLRRGILALVRFRFRRRRAVAPRALLSGVVGHIPARSLELNRRRRQRLLHFSSAMRTFLQMRPRHALDFLGTPPAFHALV